MAPPTALGLHAATADESLLLEGLLASIDDVFVESKGLPPVHAHDHHIVLKPDGASMTMRRYRYPMAHKDELEWKCTTMIE